MQDVARGRELARGLIEQAEIESALLARTLGRKATIAIVAGSDHDARRFVELKRAALAKVAIEIAAVWLDEGATSPEAVAVIAELNKRDDIDAIFLQFPLPAGVDASRAANAVVMAKDIDCSSEEAERHFLTGNSPFVPVAPQAAFDLLDHELELSTGPTIVIAGGDDPFVRALQALLQHAPGSTQVCDSSQASLQSLPPTPAALVITESLPDVRIFDVIEELPVLLDTGYYLPPRPAGWIPARARARIGVHLTQYGNVGPLTVAHLARATLKAATRGGG
ncbi:MAG TPA: tetrahydrofolate dehydrogenase/cyclohydrolase catalytic domain-containing protein [Longimicrobiales bacterium]